MIQKRPARHLPSRNQIAFALLVALAAAFYLISLREYPGSLASMMGLAIGALAYSGWGTLARLQGIYGRGSSPETEDQGNNTSERSKSR